MEVTCDPEKDTLNREEHGISSHLAKDFDLENAAVEADNRESYGWNAFGFLDGRVYNLALTIRDVSIRTISLRKVAKTERNTYAKVF